jgi:3-phosphoshikimate 1-carboxyvinyltransferase
MMAGVLAAHDFTSTMVGDESLSRRPMKRVIVPLERMGARIASTDGRPPLTIRGLRPPTPINFEPEVPSAQVKSAVLLAGLHSDGVTRVREGTATRDHTERALAAFGVEVGRDGLVVSVRGGQRLAAQQLVVPGDISSAAFWMVAAASLSGSEKLPVLGALATHGGELRVTGAGELRVKESDRISALADGFRRMGSDIEELADGFHIVGRKRLRGGEVDARHDHRLAMAFAIAALGASGPTTIHDAGAAAVSYPEFFSVLESLRA